MASMNHADRRSLAPQTACWPDILFNIDLPRLAAACAAIRESLGRNETPVQAGMDTAADSA